MQAITATSSNLLRRALQGNAVFSTLSGAAFILGAKPIAAFLGPVPPAALVVVGLGLIGFAIMLTRNSMRDAINHTEAGLAVAGDLLWVLGSGAAVLYANALGLTRGGMWAVILVADVVLLFAILQFLGLRKLRAHTQ